MKGKIFTVTLIFLQWIAQHCVLLFHFDISFFVILSISVNGSFYRNVHFSVPSLYRNITIEIHIRVTIFLDFKMKQYVIWTITSS